MSDLTNLVSFVNAIPSLYDIPGASILVQRDRRELICHQTGFSDLENRTEVQRDSIFRLYSMTKPITVTAALRLFEQGKFLLTDPVAYYLPSYWDMKMLDEAGNVVPISRPITIMDLMTMRSGLTYCGGSNPTEIATSKVVGELIARTGFAYTTREFADALSQVPVLFAPGSHWQYSYNLDVLGALIEVWSGQKFGDYLEEQIFAPLGMKDTTFFLNEDQKKRLVSLYEYHYETREHKKVVRDCDMPLYGGTVCEHGGHGLFSTIDDYGRFAQALACGGVGENGYRLLSPNTIDLMRTNFLGETELKDERTWPHLAGYGYGLGVRTMIDPTIGGNNGPLGEFGWCGLAGCYVLIDPKNRLSAVYMQCMMPNHENEIHPRLRNIIYGCCTGEDAE